jgi:hypothetical protein
MKISNIIFLLLVLYVVRLHAGNNKDTLGMSYEPALRSPGVAVGLALGATIIPIAIGYSTDFDHMWWFAASGFAIGPSVGHFYASQWGRGLTTAGLRAGLLAIGMDFAAYSIAESFFGHTSSIGSPLIAVASFLGAFGLALYDLGTTEASVNKYNDSISSTGRSYFVPHIDFRAKRYGLTFVYNFE